MVLTCTFPFLEVDGFGDVVQSLANALRVDGVHVLFDVFVLPIGTEDKGRWSMSPFSGITGRATSTCEP